MLESDLKDDRVWLSSCDLCSYQPFVSAATSKETTETECENRAPNGENTKEISVLNLLDMQLVSAHGLSPVFAQVPPHHMRMSQKTQFVSTI